jgi:membrane dipeptidase
MSHRAVSPLALLLAAAAAAAEPSTVPAAEAERLHRDAIVIDGHNDVPTIILDYGFDLGMDGGDPAKKNAALYWMLGSLLPAPAGAELRTHTDLGRLRAGGVDAQFFSIWAHPRWIDRPGGARGRALAMLDAFDEQLRRHAGEMELARTAADVRRIAAQGRLAALLGLEGGHAIENDLENLRDFHRRGVRYLTLSWSNTNDWADSSGDDARHGGLGDFGRDVVRELNRLGVLVDVSHVSDDTFWDTLEVARAPVIASHSSARALVDVPRNLSDEMLRAVARNGGLVMVNFGGNFLDARKAGNGRIALDVLRHLGPSPVPLDLALDHLEHVARVAGADHVGIGSDFDGTIFLPEGLSDVSGFPNVTRGLAARGWPEESIRKLLGENLLRVMAEAEAVARSGAAPQPPVPR